MKKSYQLLIIILFIFLKWVMDSEAAEHRLTPGRVSLAWQTPPFRYRRRADWTTSHGANLSLLFRHSSPSPAAKNPFSRGFFLLHWCAEGELPGGFRLPAFHGGGRLLYSRASLQMARLNKKSSFHNATCVCVFEGGKNRPICGFNNLDHFWKSFSQFGIWKKFSNPLRKGWKASVS